MHCWQKPLLFLNMPPEHKHFNDAASNVSPASHGAMMTVRETTRAGEKRGSVEDASVSERLKD
jgi:hypothetical protein